MREILRKFGIDMCLDNNLGNEEELQNKALQDIKQEILGKLPQVDIKKYTFETEHHNGIEQTGYINGFNNCLAQVRKIVEEL